MPSRSSDRRPSSAGIAPASVGTGVGNHASLEADRKSTRNPLWGAPRIHGELLKLGFEVAQSSVAKYMVKRCGPSSQGWCTFLRNHASDIAAMDLDYEADLERKIEDLHARVHRGAYRALPSRRHYVPKADGQQRPLAIAALEKEFVSNIQKAVEQAFVVRARQ